jgi:hypothetical protein
MKIMLTTKETKYMKRNDAKRESATDPGAPGPMHTDKLAEGKWSGLDSRFSGKGIRILIQIYVAVSEVPARLRCCLKGPQ